MALGRNNFFSSPYAGRRETESLLEGFSSFARASVQENNFLEQAASSKQASKRCGTRLREAGTGMQYFRRA
jgi:hypothetical protein